MKKIGLSFAILLMSVLQLLAQTSIDVEPANNTAPGSTMSMPVNNNAAISASSDVDFYQVTISAPGVLVVKLTGMNTNLKAKLEVFNASGTAQANSEGYFTSGLNGGDAHLELLTKTTGNYIIKISNTLSTSNSSPYNLSVTLDVADANEYNDEAGSIGGVTPTVLSMDKNVPTVFQGKIFGYKRINMIGYLYADYEDLIPDQDFYKVDVTTPGVMVIDLSNVPAEVQAGIEVFNSTGTSNNESEGYRVASSAGSNVKLELLTKTSGTYYIVIRNRNTTPNGSNQNASQQYKLSVHVDTLGKEYNDETGGPWMLGINQVITGKIFGYKRLNMIGYLYAAFGDLIPDKDHYEITPGSSYMYARVFNVPANLKIKITAIGSNGTTVLGSKTSAVAGDPVILYASDLSNPSDARFFKVEDVNTVNGSNTSELNYSFVVSNWPLSVHTEIDRYALSYYPNPVAEELNVVCPDNWTIALWTIDGRQVLKETMEKRMSLSGIPDGTYLLTFRNEAGKLYQVETVVKK